MKITNKKTYICFVICLILLTFGVVHKTFENDTFFTIATGNYIMENGVNDDEPFTIHDNLKFVKLRWAFDIVIANIYKFFGFSGIYLFVLIVSIGIAITLFTIFSKNKFNKVVSLAVVCFTMVFCSNYLRGRAQIISYLLFILEFYFIEKLVKNNNKKDSICLVIISYLILCFHSSVWLVYFLIYIPFIVEHILVKLKVNKVLKLKKLVIEEHNIKLLLITMGCAILTGFLTPLGLSPFTYMFKVMGGISKQIIVELQPLTLVGAVPLIVFGVIALISAIFPKTKVKIIDIFIIFGFTCMSIMAERNLYIGLFVMSFSYARIITSFVNEYDKNKILDKIENVINNSIIGKVIVIMLFLALTSITYSQIYKEQYVSEKSFPVQASEYIKENLDLSTLRMFTGFNFGSYVEFKGIPAFLDSRSEIYTKEFNNVTILEDYANCALLYNTSLDSVIEKYNLNYVLTYSNKHYNLWGKYKLVKEFDDGNFCLYKVEKY